MQRLLATALTHTDEAYMTDLNTLWTYIKKHAPPGGIEGFDGSPGKFRDLQQYHEKKVSRWENAGGASVRKAGELITDPLEVCGLRRESTLLSTPDNPKRIAVAAMLLAMSIVLNLDEDTLRKAKPILERRDILDLEMRLKILLSTGDVFQSTRFPSLQLKNFNSVSIGFESVQTTFILGAENAFESATDLLTLMHQRLLHASSGIPEQYKETFTSYFGNPDEKVDVAALGFQGGSELGLSGSQTRSALVRAVLQCVWKGIQMRPVRLYYGGGSVIPNVRAYAPDLKTVRRDGKINIHLAIDFFSLEQQVIHDGMSISRGAGLIHEFTHALAGTIDVDQAFMPGRCRALAKDRDFGPRALANAQSYASFVEDAFG
ncbi:MULTISPECIES: hypothetical protein [Paraburkholderia]|uniref:hypothetical protein n=1 Tax=Paraburkholderia TaxID=1822464 RepID=UPI00195507BA|nr:MULTISPECIES: hypothetical protein [Paraburkholderia]MDH6146546.1 hypothetical protein [Paraburkholderia sp. WSM4179]